MEFAGTLYDGERTTDDHRFDGLGQYTFANGDVYVGGMKDGALDGHGIIFFRTRATRTPSTAAKETDTSESSPSLKQFLSGAAGNTDVASVPAADEDAEGAWSGHYRGFWKNGTHLWGSYVFRDGLVYGSQPAGSLEGPPSSAHPHDLSALDHTSTTFWAYCQSDDHRLWSEHLRHLAPVLPYETVLGGARTTAAGVAARAGQSPAAAEAASAATLWVDMPMLVPSSRLDTLTAPSVAQGQPQSGADIVDGWWHADGAGHAHGGTRPSTAEPSDNRPSRTAAHTAAVTAGAAMPLSALLTLPTPPLLPEQDPDQIARADGTFETRARRVVEPALVLRYTHVETLLQTGGRTLVLQPCTAAQRAAQKAHTSAAATDGSAGRGGLAQWSRPACTAAIAAPALAPHRAATGATTTPTTTPTTTTTTTRPTAPRPPPPRPTSGNSRSASGGGTSTGRARQIQQQRAASPTPTATNANANTTLGTDMSTTVPSPSPGLPQLLVTLVPKASVAPLSSDGDVSEADEVTPASTGVAAVPVYTTAFNDASYSGAPPPEMSNNCTQCAPDFLADMAAQAVELPSMEVPLIVLNTIPKVSQLSDVSDDEEPEADDTTTTAVDVETTMEGGEAHNAEAASVNREETAALTLQGFARMARAKGERAARVEALACYRDREEQNAAEAFAESAPEEMETEDDRVAEADADADIESPFTVTHAMADEDGWVEEAEYNSTEL